MTVRRAVVLEVVSEEAVETVEFSCINTVAVQFVDRDLVADADSCGLIIGIVPSMRRRD